MFSHRGSVSPSRGELRVCAESLKRNSPRKTSEFYDPTSSHQDSGFKLVMSSVRGFLRRKLKARVCFLGFSQRPRPKEAFSFGGAGRKKGWREGVGWSWGQHAEVSLCVCVWGGWGVPRSVERLSSATAAWELQRQRSSLGQRSGGIGARPPETQVREGPAAPHQVKFSLHGAAACGCGS